MDPVDANAVGMRIALLATVWLLATIALTVVVVGTRQRRAWSRIRPAHLGCGLVLAAMGLASRHAVGGAWPLREGAWQIITQMTPYEAKISGFDPGGRQAGSGTYDRIEYSSLVEYGLTPQTTIGVQARAQSIWQDAGAVQGEAHGLAELNVFARQTLYRGDWDAYALQAQIGIPGFQWGDENPAVAEPNLHAEFRALYGRGFELPGGWTGFGEVQAAFRYRAGLPADEVRLDVTLGLRPLPDWMLLAQQFSTFGLKNNEPMGADYDIHRLQLSIVHDLTPSVSLQLGAFREYAGRNTALGNAVIAALWLRF